MKTFLQYLKIAVTASALCGLTAQADIVNGGFETGNTSGWSTLGNVGAATSVNFGVGTVNPYSGSYSALLNTNNISAGTLAAQMGISEGTLEASNGGINATNGSLLYQTVAATAGNSFQFNWNFVENDYVPFDDWAFYAISYNGNPAVVTKFASLATVGPGSGTTIAGWQTLNVNIGTSGNYTFYFGVVNALDQILDSYLFVDGVTSAAPGVPDSGSTVALLGLVLVGFAAIRRKLS